MEDIVKAVDFARSNELLLAVRSGGHSLLANSLTNGCLVTDLSALKQIRIDPQRRVVRVQTAVTAGELDKATAAYGMATVLGECTSVGVSGLILGVGFGRLMGTHGAACDNLVSAELVMADGRVVAADEHQNQDLFWAIRGGGGNFGVASSLEFRLHPVRRFWEA